jgi:hypothetical protein
LSIALICLPILTIDFQYTGESMDINGMVALLNYRVSQNVTGVELDLIAHFLFKEDGVTRMCYPSRSVTKRSSCSQQLTSPSGSTVSRKSNFDILLSCTLHQFILERSCESAPFCAHTGSLNDYS